MLGPFDYENEVYTRELWIAEGFTSYYDDLTLLRAGKMTEDEWLAAMSKNLRRVEEHPGHLVQPLSEASFDAWIEYYRKDEDTTNQAVSYYLKGAIVAWLLDTEVRRRTSGARSLDDVLRVAWERFATSGYTDAQFRSLTSEVVGSDMSAWFTTHVDRAEPLDLAPALTWWGLEVEGADDPEPWLGLTTSDRGGRVVVAEVKRDGPGWDAGVNPGDELLAVGGWRVGTDELRLEGRAVGEELTVVVARRGRVRELPLVLGAEPQPRVLAIDDAAEPATARRRALWAWASEP